MYNFGLRQSDEWSRYLEFSGWVTIKTSNNIKVRFLKFLGKSLVKIQKCPPLNKADLEEIESICRENKALFIKIEPGVGQDEQLLKDSEYQPSQFPLSPTTSLVIDLSKSEVDLWNDLSRGCKYSVRRARREGAKVSFIKNPSTAELEKLYKVVKETGKRNKFYVQALEDLQTKVEILKDKSYITEVDGMGSKFFIGCENVITYLYGGTTMEGRKNKSGYELMWQSMLYFKKLEYRWLDLEGLDDDRFPRFTRGWGGFSHFKEKFGGFRVEFPPPYIKYLNSVLRFISKYNEIPL